MLAEKVLLAPICVVAVSLAGRRWGVAVAGVLGGLPVIAGPILLVETMLHGAAFGAKAAAGTLLGLAALTAFVVVYGRFRPPSTPFGACSAGGRRSWSASRSSALPIRPRGCRCWRLPAASGSV